jgi:diguanylate cyclase (GGDEF)-like protein/PAS domain S-box-containing protein
MKGNEQDWVQLDETSRRHVVKPPLSAKLRGLLRRLRQALQLLLASAFSGGLGLFIPAGMGEIAEQQTRNLRTTAVALSLCGGNGVIMVMADFGGQTGPLGWALAAAIIALYTVWEVLAAVSNGRPWFMRASVILLAIQGVFWGLLIYRLAEVATGKQTNFVTAISMALVSTPLLGGPFAIAMAFWIPAAIGAELALAQGVKHADAYLAVSFLGYEAFTLVGIVAINRMLMQLSVARVRLRQQNATVGLLLRDYEENASDWLWETDRATRLRHVTPRFAQVLRSSAEAVDGRRLREALGVESTNNPEAAELIQAMEDHKPFRDVPIKIHLPDEVRWICLTGRPVEDADGEFAGYRGVGADITEARRATEESRFLATHDAMTGMANRRMFIERLEQACTTALEVPARLFAILMIDLDRFKEINDDHGHGSGDAVLVAIAHRLSRNIRPGDTIARLGGDEFAVIMPHVGPREATVAASRLIEVLSEPLRIGESWLGVGASIGVALFPRDGRATVELMRNADLALYRAKQSGRGTFRLFEPSYGEEFLNRAALLADLRTTVMEEGFSVDYQPIIGLATGDTVSMEALCRWTHPVRGSIPPAVFIPLAEESGLISLLGRQILLQACRAAVAWRPSVCVSVNLSPLQLKDPGLAADIAAVLAEAELEPKRLELELTESAWLKADSQTIRQLDLLGEMGVQIVMDDFGTGFSSLSTLRSFRFKGIKIDAEFIRDIETDPKAGGIVRMVSALAAELDITLTAEGIETEGQLTMVRSFGIPRAQGYLLGRPSACARLC